MGAPLTHVGLTAMCPHGGTIMVSPSSPRVKLGGQVATTSTDTWTVAGCPLNISGSPAPCLQVQWTAPATRVKIGGQPVVLQSSSGLCTGGGPPGPPQISSTQMRVSGQ